MGGGGQTVATGGEAGEAARAGDDAVPGFGSSDEVSWWIQSAGAGVVRRQYLRDTFCGYRFGCQTAGLSFPFHRPSCCVIENCVKFESLAMTRDSSHARARLQSPRQQR